MNVDIYSDPVAVGSDAAVRAPTHRVLTERDPVADLNPTAIGDDGKDAPIGSVNKTAPTRADPFDEAGSVVPNADRQTSDKEVSPKGTPDTVATVIASAPVTVEIVIDQVAEPVTGSAYERALKAALAIAAAGEDRRQRRLTDEEHSNRRLANLYISVSDTMEGKEWFIFRKAIGWRGTDDPNFEFAAIYFATIAHPKRVRPGSKSKKNIARGARSRTKSAMLELRARKIEPRWDTVHGAMVEFHGASSLERLWAQRKKDAEAEKFELVPNDGDQEDGTPLTGTDDGQADADHEEAGAEDGDGAGEGRLAGVANDGQAAGANVHGDGAGEGNHGTADGDGSQPFVSASGQAPGAGVGKVALHDFDDPDMLVKVIAKGVAHGKPLLIIDDITERLLTRILEALATGRQAVLTLGGTPPDADHYVAVHLVGVKVSKAAA